MFVEDRSLVINDKFSSRPGGFFKRYIKGAKSKHITDIMASIPLKPIARTIKPLKAGPFINKIKKVKKTETKN
jgi:hypothetical protein